MSMLRLRVMEGQRLKAVRLSDLPVQLRKDAALRVADAAHRSVKPERGRSDGRVRSTQAERWTAVEAAAEVMQKALFPSERLYWIPADAYDEVMAEIAKAEKDERRRAVIPAGATSIIEAA